MSKEERARLKQLEGYIGLTRAGAGAALREIRDAALYRETHKSFEAYVEARWGISRRTAYNWIEEADKRIVQKLHTNAVFYLNKDGSIETENEDEEGGEEGGEESRSRDAQRLADLELLSAGASPERLSVPMRESLERAAERLCRIEHKGIGPDEARCILPGYVSRIADKCVELAPPFVELVQNGEMKAGRAVAGLMGELFKGFPRSPVNHLANLETGLKKLQTSLHLWDQMEELAAANGDEVTAASRKRRMVKWVSRLAETFPAEWRQVLVSAWRGGGQ
jgi:hypothetical protein